MWSQLKRLPTLSNPISQSDTTYMLCARDNVLLPLLLAILLAILTHEEAIFASEQFGFRSFADMALIRTEKSDDKGVTTVTFADQVTGWRTQVTFHSPSTQTTEIWDEAGKLIEKNELGQGYQTIEAQWPKKEKREIHWIRNEDYESLVYAPKKEKWNLVSRSKINLAAFLQDQCVNPIGLDDLEKKINETGPLVQVAVAPDEPDDKKVKLGLNIQAVGCQNYGDEGEKELARDIDEAFNTGLRCLAGLYTWKPRGDVGMAISSERPELPGARAYWRAQAALLLGYFEPSQKTPFTFHCFKSVKDVWKNEVVAAKLSGLFASARNCGKESDAPGMYLYLNNFKPRARADKLATLFHELVHMTGLLHETDGKQRHDAVYDAQNCCFGKSLMPPPSGEMVSEIACVDLLAFKHGEIRKKVKK